MGLRLGRRGIRGDDHGGGWLHRGGARLRDLAPVDVGVALVVAASAAAEGRVVVAPVVAFVLAHGGLGADVVVALASSGGGVSGFVCLSCPGDEESEKRTVRGIGKKKRQGPEVKLTSGRRPHIDTPHKHPGTLQECSPWDRAGSRGPPR